MNGSRKKTSGLLIHIGYISHDYEHDEIVADLIYLKYLKYNDTEEAYNKWKNHLKEKYGFNIIEHKNELYLQYKTKHKMVLPLNRIKEKLYNDL